MTALNGPKLPDEIVATIDLVIQGCMQAINNLPFVTKTNFSCAGIGPGFHRAYGGSVLPGPAWDKTRTYYSIKHYASGTQHAYLWVGYDFDDPRWEEFHHKVLAPLADDWQICDGSAENDTADGIAYYFRRHIHPQDLLLKWYTIEYKVRTYWTPTKRR